MLKELTQARFSARMSHPRAVFNEAHVLAEQQGIDLATAKALTELYSEMIISQSAKLVDEIARLHAQLLDGAKVSLPGGQMGICRPTKSEYADRTVVRTFPVFLGEELVGFLKPTYEEDKTKYYLAQPGHYPQKVDVVI